MMNRIILAITVLLVLTASACQPGPETVVIYTSVDQVFSEPVFDRFREETGITVLPVYDVEAAKTTGLVNRLIAEKSHPIADVFWSGEFAQTITLQEANVLAPYTSPNAEGIPPVYRDPDGYWVGFAGRARVILVNTGLVPENRMPTSIDDFLDPAWTGDQLGIAYPLFGTTATQVAALYAQWGRDEGRSFFEQLAARDLQVVDGNSVVRDMVVDGRLAFGLTDTDDACSAVASGAPVRIVIPDQGAGRPGTLIIPNTVALIAGGPNPEAGKRLIDYLLSEAVAEQLISSGWSHVSVGDAKATSACLQGTPIRGMDVDLTAVYDQMLPANTDMTALFVR